MSAPGNSVILLVLLSLFMGCAGYAVGRLHERRMSGEEREEAYRDGYDHAARSVFSLAARVAGPRRRGSVRASAVVGEEARKGESAPSGGTSVIPDTGVVGAPVAAVGGTASVGTPGDLPGSSLGAVAPAPSGIAAGSPVAASSSGSAASSAVTASPASPASPVGAASAEAPASAPVSRRRGPASRPPGVGFPAPAPHVVPGLPEPAAGGGVSYSSLPDPHWSGQTEPIVAPPSPASPAPAPQFSPASPAPAPQFSPAPSTSPASPYSPAASSAPASPYSPASPSSSARVADSRGVPAPRAARHSAEPERAGRHTVPDELVRAATYKLAADRVARAKVRAPEDPTDPPVPRPRGQ